MIFDLLIMGFVAILIGVSLVGPISSVTSTSCTTTGNLSLMAPWGNTVCNLVPGFFALGIMGVGVAIVLGVFRSAGIGT